MKRCFKEFAALSLFLLFFAPVYAQQNEERCPVFTDSTTKFLDFTAYGSNRTGLPFWVHANQFGTVPQRDRPLLGRLGLEHYWSISKRNERNLWRGGLGLEVAGNFANEKKFLLPQLHGTLRYKHWEVFVGRKKQVVGLADTTLGTGSYAWSSNALPIPKIQIGTTRFVDVPYTNGWVAVNTFYSDGFFEKGRPFTSGLKLHQKAFYARIGGRNSRLKFLGGFNHQVQWGGRSPFETKDGEMPDGFRNYLYVITGKASPVGNDLTEFDLQNRIGNHLGSIDLAVQYLGYEYSWFIYRQHIYEDGSLAKFLNIADGLNGIAIKKQHSYGAAFEVTDMVLEFLFTKSQGGSIWDLSTVLGRDNYFNHSQVRDGWSYFGRTIGTPFIPPTSDTDWKWPAYSFTSNNRVSVFHLGIKGTLCQKLYWESKLSYSTNEGTYDFPFAHTAGQFSGFICLGTKLNIFGGIHSSVSFASDVGMLYPETYGFSLGLRKFLGKN